MASNRSWSGYRTCAVALMMATLMTLPVGAQWKNRSMDGVPMLNGKPDMNAPAPMTSYGKPDLSGIYQSTYRYFQNLAADIGLANVPMTTEARKLQEARATGLLSYEEPDSHCLPQGVPKINMAPLPFKIVQQEKLVVIIYEAFNLWRQIHLDGRDFDDDLNPSWMGYSKGRWEGNELVVETRGLNGKQWLDHGGLPASDKLVVTERFRRPNFGRLEIAITINDPTYYTKPWTATTPLRLLTDTELFEFVCNENERSTKHMGPHIK